MWGTAVKYSIALCAVGFARKKGTFDPILNLKCFIQAVKLRWPTQKLMRPPNFPSFFCGPLETGVPSRRGA